MSFAGTRSGVTRNFAHLKPPKPSSKFDAKSIPSNLREPQHFVHPQDRIPFWNLAPGDEVKLRTGRVGQDLGFDPREKLRGEGIVQSVDKKRNVLYLTDTDAKNPRAPKSLKHIPSRMMDENEPEKGREGNVVEVPRAVHYSNLVLRIPPGEGDKNAPPRYAYRLERRNVHYNRHLRRWMWQRIAVVKEADGTTSRIEVPWPEPERPRPQNRAELTKRDVVEEETWLPWSPFDPVLLNPERPWASPISEAQVEVRRKEMAQRAAEAKRAADLERGEGAKRRMGVYAGFAERNKRQGYRKATPVPQPPTASEILALAGQKRADWVAGEASTHIENGGRSFAPSDYLDLAPREGPAAGNWTLPVDTEAEKRGAGYAAGFYRRDEATGRLVAPFPEGKEDGPSSPALRLSRAHLDSLPIELLMRDDLENKHSRKHKARRRAIREEVEGELALEEQKREREEVHELRKAMLEKMKLRDEAEEEAVAETAAEVAAKAVGQPQAAPSASEAAEAAIAPEVSEEIAEQASGDVKKTTGEKTS
ncbi:hypothetical protein BDZ90DRAFT_230674 [Jaminaea rosea]|uniref:KOW domain-containing protein n=1 Tax=Jaminaea rosea TaxID=1569628 RepID=A0A316UX04_9BASI|nr:hypothetical protein BDZ90DRAFT_230674 [Jaminaea rosea]PWN29836.1 hypothetical protein BDZ90DRAFT_230674 [Jaminaea rosea]